MPCNRAYVSLKKTLKNSNYSKSFISKQISLVKIEIINEEKLKVEKRKIDEKKNFRANKNYISFP